MSFKDSKVAIIGAGNVGATTAYSIINQGLCEEVVLIDVNKDKAYAEALDMAHSVYFMNRNIKIYAGEYKDCSDADVVIITASAPMPKDSHSRLEMLAPSMNIMKSIVTSVMDSGFDGIILVISNPVDIMTYYAWKISGLPYRQVIGSGTNLDSARLCCELAKLYDLDAKSVSAFVCGEHGDSEIAAWSSANISGIPLDNFCEMRGHYNHMEATERIAAEVKQSAYEIISKKGATYYGIAMSVKRICEAIIRDEKSILPISTMLHGEYGISDVVLSLPCIVGRDGYETKVPIDLDQEEVSKLHESANTLKEVLSEFFAEN